MHSWRRLIEQVPQFWLFRSYDRRFMLSGLDGSIRQRCVFR